MSILTPVCALCQKKMTNRCPSNGYRELVEQVKDVRDVETFCAAQTISLLCRQAAKCPIEFEVC